MERKSSDNTECIYVCNISRGMLSIFAMSFSIPWNLYPLKILSGKRQWQYKSVDWEILVGKQWIATYAYFIIQFWGK